jgi:hypothetical protein
MESWNPGMMQNISRRYARAHRSPGIPLVARDVRLAGYDQTLQIYYLLPTIYDSPFRCFVIIQAPGLSVK